MKAPLFLAIGTAARGAPSNCLDGVNELVCSTSTDLVPWTGMGLMTLGLMMGLRAAGFVEAGP